ncbi:MAG: rhodanese-like domain-containing protein [Proteobacteria bacterium]|jgi:rhodanese-related sulfurtransferase|nr:rhodanese-like domain-containing protein [Pseudomonadota bacterium]MCG6935830.1 rhodanese-like domain-containing protein [Pseudomonadota bacterium]
MTYPHPLRMMSLVFLSLLFQQQATAASEFPGRKIYLDTPYIELKQFEKEFDKVVIVDVRSAYEYQTLHIKNAVNIPLRSKDFVAEMRILREKNPKKKIITYCNGKTCMKSYKAAAKCRTKGISNVVAFDAGIMDWAKADPDRSVLLGVSPINPDRLISKKKFTDHLLSPETFFEQANSGRSLIVDVRDPLQRAGMPLFIGKEQRASLDDNNKLKLMIQRAKAENRTLYIYDEAGKQVRWLMYYLEDQDAQRYYFMKGGAKKFFKDMSNDFKS